MFGVCMGFQLLALAHGWDLRVLRDGHFGLYPIARTEAGRSDPLLAALGPDAVAFEQRRWGVFSTTASRGTPLAHGPEGDVSAARFGPHAAGAVFHPEAHPDAVRRFLTEDAAARDKAVQLHGPNAATHMLQTIDHLHGTWAHIIPGFLARQATP
jgi:GMP synthase-like glutamine amidotransferase